MNNRIVHTLLVLTMWMVGMTATSQIVTPVKWKSHVEEKGNELILSLTATVEEGWHVYDMNVGEDGPQATTVTYVKTEGLEPAGGLKDKGKAIEQYDSTFMMELSWWEGAVRLEQRFKIKEEKWKVEGQVRYMCCDDESCLPPEKWKFTHEATAKAEAQIVTETEEQVVEEDIKEAQEEETVDSVSPEFGVVSKEEEKESLLSIFLFGLVAGLLALLTPCVWPVMPMTVSFFLHRKNGHGKRDAVLYGLSIFVIYVALGVFVTVFFGASALNALSTNAALNIVFFILMVLFALSFFGYFDLSLPASWGNAVNGKARSLSGVVSILLMAFVLVIVSFSCTGPIIGTLLVQVAMSEDYAAPVVGMVGFAIALALPFTMCAMFPSIMNKLPKSGGWMAHIKVLLACVEMLFALKFLSVADMTMQWGILPRWLFIVMWGAIGLLLALYLVGAVRFPCNYGDRKRSVGLRLLSVVPLVFALYMGSGLLGNPLHGVSAFLPPNEKIAKGQVVFDDYEKGMAYAREKGMPVFVDFTGYGCVNCRKMEAAVFSQDTVKRLLEKFVVIRLYTDSRKELEQPRKVVERGEELELETKGEQWSHLQRTLYGVNAQPFYVTMNASLPSKYGTYAYDEDVEDFVDFLERSLAAYADK